MTKVLKALEELKYKGFYYSKDGIDISTFVQMRLDIIEAYLKQIDKLPKTEFYTTSKIELNNELDKKFKAFEKLEYIEEVLEKHNIPYEMLDKVLEAIVVLHNNNATPLFPKEVKIL